MRSPCCLCVPTFQLLNKLANLHEKWHKCYITTVYCQLVLNQVGFNPVTICSQAKHTDPTPE